MKIRNFTLAALLLVFGSAEVWACNKAVGPESASSSSVTTATATSSSQDVAAAVTSAIVAFKISPVGRFRATVTLNEASDDTCRIAIHGRMAVNPDDEPTAIQSQRRIKTKVLKRGRTRMVFTALTMPPVRQYDGEDAVLNLMARVTCGETVLTVGPVARYAICGASNKTSITARQYIRQLQLKTK